MKYKILLIMAILLILPLVSALTLTENYTDRWSFETTMANTGFNPTMTIINNSGGGTSQTDLAGLGFNNTYYHDGSYSAWSYAQKFIAANFTNAPRVTTTKGATWTMWVKRNALSQRFHLLSGNYGGANPGDVEISFNTGGDIDYYILNSTATGAEINSGCGTITPNPGWCKSNVITDTNWHFIVFQFGTNITMYIDGVIVSSTRFEAATQTKFGPYPWYLGLGEFSGSATTQYGHYDDVRFYNYTLNSTEITYLYNGSAATPPSISISSPSGTYNFGSNGGILNLTTLASGSDLDTCWYNYNNTNTTFQCTNYLRKEYYTTGADAYHIAYGTGNLAAQTFMAGNTTAGNIILAAVNLSLYKIGNPGIAEIDIFPVNSTGAPVTNGNPLSRGTFNSNDLTTNTNGEWKLISMPLYNLTSGTTYAIVLNNSNGDTNNRILWLEDGSSPSYLGGMVYLWGSIGNVWSQYPDRDNMFEVMSLGGTGNVITPFSQADVNKKSILVYANDTYGSLANATTSWDYTIFENSQIYNPTTTSLSNEQYILNITYNSSAYSSIQANLIWNGTSHNSIISNAGNNPIFTSNVNIPSVSSLTNASFYWMITLNGNQYINTSSSTQTINNLTLSICDGNTVLILNYTLKDEDSQGILTGSISSTITLSNIYDSTKYITYSVSNTSTSNLRFCLNNNISTSNYLLSAITSYESPGHVSRFNHIQNMQIDGSNIPNNIDLFDLNSTESTTFTIKYQNDVLLPIQGIIILTQRKNLGLGIFQTVETSQTDSSGQAPVHLVLNNGIYNFIALQNNQVIASMDSTGNGFTVTCQTLPCLINFFQFNAGVQPDDFTNSQNFAYAPSYSSSSRLFTLIWSTKDGSASNVALNVTLIDPYMNNTLCYDNLTSSSGLYTCSVPSNVMDGFIKVTILKDGNFVAMGNYDVSSNTASSISGPTGAIMSVLIILTLAGAGISGGAIGVLIFTIIGLILSGALMLITNGSIFGFTSVIIWLIVIIIIFIVKIAKSRSQ